MELAGQHLFVGAIASRQRSCGSLKEMVNGEIKHSELFVRLLHTRHLRSA